MEYKWTIQPYVVICGDLRDIVNSYVLVNEYKYSCSSVLEAVDVCFKSFFALDASYPVLCPHVWTFLDKYVYKLSKKCTNYSSASRLLIDLDNLSDDSYDV